MKTNIIMKFDRGMPTGTAQQKGETIKYKIVNGRRVPYVHHFRTAKMNDERVQFILGVRPYKPKEPSTEPIRLTINLFFDIKNKKLWGQYKATRPDCDNYVKELTDVMTQEKFWHDDAQVVELHVTKQYAEKAEIHITVEELKGGLNDE